MNKIMESYIRGGLSALQSILIIGLFDNVSCFFIIESISVGRICKRTSERITRSYCLSSFRDGISDTKSLI